MAAVSVFLCISWDSLKTKNIKVWNHLNVIRLKTAFAFLIPVHDNHKPGQLQNSLFLLEICLLSLQVRIVQNVVNGVEKLLSLEKMLERRQSIQQFLPTVNYNSTP